MHLLQCVLYAAGLCLAFAFDDLSFKAVTSQSPIYIGEIYVASNAIDRNTATCMRTDAIGPNIQDKNRNTWWKVDFGSVYNIYSINILFKNYDGHEYRQRGRFAGFSLFVSNSGDIQGSSLCYKDGPQLPPLNFTTTCTEYGRYVIFYNERKEGVVYPEGYQLSTLYTELCEVIVQGCKQSGVYGTECNIPCPAACKNNTCHIQNGACLYCEHGIYGINCNMSCPDNCQNNMCHVQNGTCLTCKPGWTGMYCKTKCKDGSHGVNCTKLCTGHCKNGTACNHITGLCHVGCAEGWTGYMCDKACIQSYGENCQHPCSPHCFNQTCDRFSGRCLLCCANTFHGERCQEKPKMLKQNASTLNIWKIGLIVSVVINFIFIAGVCLLCRWIYTKKVSISSDLLCSKRSIYYTNTDVKSGENSTYQELDLPREEIQYQNTTIR